MVTRVLSCYVVDMVLLKSRVSMWILELSYGCWVDVKMLLLVARLF